MPSEGAVLSLLSSLTVYFSSPNSVLSGLSQLPPDLEMDGQELWTQVKVDNFVGLLTLKAPRHPTSPGKDILFKEENTLFHSLKIVFIWYCLRHYIYPITVY